MNTRVSIVIPNWNGQTLLKKNLPFVLKASEAIQSHLQEIIVVDDGSTDESVFMVRSKFPSVTLIELKENVGFHRATNIGFKKSIGDIVILLNTDIEPTIEAFSSLIPHFSDPLLFGVSGRIYAEDKTTFLYGNRGAFFRYGHFYLQEKAEFSTTQNLFVCGGAGAFNREKFLSLGGFDTLFFPFYYEEQDVSYRALKRGWHIAYEPSSVMFHQIRGTIAKKAKQKKISYISARNNYLFVIKNITDPIFTFEMVLYIPLFLLRDLFRLKFRFWVAFCMCIPRIPHALKKRFQEKKYARLTDKEIFNLVKD